MLSQDFQPRPVWKAANSLNRAITKRRLDSCSRGANAENIPLGVVSLIAGCSGLKGGFSSPCLWKSWAEVVMIEVRVCCWLRFDFSQSVILQPIPKTFFLKNGSSCSCLSLVPLTPQTNYLFQWLSNVPLITSSWCSIYWQWATVDVCVVVGSFKCHSQPIIKQITFILCL